MGGPNRLTFDSWSQELRLNGDAFGSHFHYTLGGFWMEQDIFYTSRQDLRYVPGAPLVFVSGDPVPAFTRAAFAAWRLRSHRSPHLHRWNPLFRRGEGLHVPPS